MSSLGSAHSPNSLTASSSLQLTRSALERSTNAKVKLEKYYESLLHQALERESRRLIFERDYLEQAQPDHKVALERSFAKKESDFLRLKRMKLSVLDFQTIKVIGKGAFGEV